MGFTPDLHQHTGARATEPTFCRDLPAHIKAISTFSELLKGAGLAGVTVRAWQPLPEQKGEVRAVMGAHPGVCSANPQAFIDHKLCPKIISRHLK